MRLLILTLLTAASLAAQTRVDPARVDRLVKGSIIVDLHDDTTQLIVDEGYDLGELHDYGQVDIPRMRRGGITGVFFSIYTNTQRVSPVESIRRALIQMDAVRQQTLRHPRDLIIATTADQIVAAKKQ